MRTKARDGFIKALRDAHRWLDELLYAPTQTIESLAVREGKSERSIRMTLSLAFISPSWRKPRWGVGFRVGSASSA
jgi:site-specific DNA recombinase